MAKPALASAKVKKKQKKTAYFVFDIFEFKFRRKQAPNSRDEPKTN